MKKWRAARWDECWRESRGDRLGAFIFTTTKCIGAVHRVSGGGGPRSVLLEEGCRVLPRKPPIDKGRAEEADKVEVRFKGSKGDQGRKDSILVRVANSSRRNRGAVELLVELIRGQGEEGLPPSLPLMAYRSEAKWAVWTRRQATQGSRSGPGEVTRRWEERARGAVAKVRLEEFTLHSGRIGGATALTADGTKPMVMHRERRWSSDALMAYVRANMEDSW